MRHVPDFFQLSTAQARGEQMKWLSAHYRLPQSFFVRVLRLDPNAALPEAAAKGMEVLWPMFLHMMSFVHFSVEDGQQLVNMQWPTKGREAGSPAWTGRSIRDYLEDQGLPGAAEVDRWLTSFRFVDRYARVPGSSGHSALGGSSAPASLTPS